MLLELVLSANKQQQLLALVQQLAHHVRHALVVQMLRWQLLLRQHQLKQQSKLRQ
jgi:hypothetical protein